MVDPRGLVCPILTKTSLIYSHVALHSHVSAETVQPVLYQDLGTAKGSECWGLPTSGYAPLELAPEWCPPTKEPWYEICYRLDVFKTTGSF